MNFGVSCMLSSDLLSTRFQIGIVGVPNWLPVDIYVSGKLGSASDKLQFGDFRHRLAYDGGWRLPHASVAISTATIGRISHSCASGNQTAGSPGGAATLQRRSSDLTNDIRSIALDDRLAARTEGKATDADIVQ